MESDNSSKQTSKEVVLADSSIWVAIALNFFPGIGTGYIYQRRWKAYWITGISSLIWLYLCFAIQGLSDPSDPVPQNNDQLAFYGIIFIEIYSAIESLIVIRKTRDKLQDSN